jgi:hypothetical protein
LLCGFAVCALNVVPVKVGGVFFVVVVFSAFVVEFLASRSTFHVEHALIDAQKGWRGVGQRDS